MLARNIQIFVALFYTINGPYNLFMSLWPN